MRCYGVSQVVLLRRFQRLNGRTLVKASDGLVVGSVLGNDPGDAWASLRLDIGGPDHLAPLPSFVGNELAEFGG